MGKGATFGAGGLAGLLIGIVLGGMYLNIAHGTGLNMGDPVCSGHTVSGVAWRGSGSLARGFWHCDWRCVTGGAWCCFVWHGRAADPIRSGPLAGPG